MRTGKRSSCRKIALGRVGPRGTIPACQETRRQHATRRHGGIRQARSDGVLFFLFRFSGGGALFGGGDLLEAALEFLEHLVNRAVKLD